MAREPRYGGWIPGARDARTLHDERGRTAVKITITMNIDPGYEDPGHSMGVTEAGYEGISAALAPYGDNIEIEQG